MADSREGSTTPAGEPKTLKRAILEAGARLLQDTTPVKQFDIYMVGFHPAKHDPSLQMEAHHYCHQVNADFLQCVLFDGNTETANLIGIEYIISERLFASLPQDEQTYWHPHNYEILSGSLVAPGLPDRVEKAMLKLLMNSHGKTWHLWHTSQHDGGPGDRLPLGDPMLMWSFNRDGEMDERLRHSRDERLQINSQEKRRDRQDLVALAHPQRGVDALKGAFPNATEPPPPGVRETGSAMDPSESD